MINMLLYGLAALLSCPAVQAAGLQGRDRLMTQPTFAYTHTGTVKSYNAQTRSGFIEKSSVAGPKTVLPDTDCVEDVWFNHAGNPNTDVVSDYWIQPHDGSLALSPPITQDYMHNVQGSEFPRRAPREVGFNVTYDEVWQPRAWNLVRIFVGTVKWLEKQGTAGWVGAIQSKEMPTPGGLVFFKRDVHFRKLASGSISFQDLQEGDEIKFTVAQTEDRLGRVWAQPQNLQRVRVATEDAANADALAEEFIAGYEVLHKSWYPIVDGGRQLPEGWIALPEGFLTAAESTLPPRLIGMDCEMIGVGPNKNESALARVTVVDEDGRTLLDLHVKPRWLQKHGHHAVDYRTEFSGISEGTWAKEGIDWVDFSVAQELFAELLKPNMVIVGHSMENDFDVLKFALRKTEGSKVNLNIVDTALLFPRHDTTRAAETAGPVGVPPKPKKSTLKWLADKWLAGQGNLERKNGHDSAEDANVAVKLAKIARGLIFARQFLRKSQGN